jgi:CheY-like chemotaxis protein
MTLPHAAKPQATHWPPRGPARVLVILERPMLAALIKLTSTTAPTRRVLSPPWARSNPSSPTGMDLDGSRIMSHLSARSADSARLPVIGLTRRGDLRNKLAAFETGVDDILTVPFAPEELLVVATDVWPSVAWTRWMAAPRSSVGGVGVAEPVRRRALETGIAANQHVAASCHIFRPLNCTPSIICRFATRKTTRSGTALITAPAIIGPNESA